MAIFTSSRNASFYLMAVVITICGLFAGRSMAQTNYMLSGDILKAGQNLSTVDFSLRMQPDCNLVLYGYPLKAVWSTNTFNKGSGCELRLQNNGNLAIYDEDQKVVWQSGTNGTDGHYVLLLQQNRNVVLYSDTQWNSGTASLTK